MLEHRLQILLDRNQYQRVSREAARRGTSIAAVIRDAINHLPDDEETRRAAIDAILAAAPMAVPDDPSDLQREIDEARYRDHVFS